MCLCAGLEDFRWEGQSSASDLWLCGSQYLQARQRAQGIWRRAECWAWSFRNCSKSSSSCCVLLLGLYCQMLWSNSKATTISVVQDISRRSDLKTLILWSTSHLLFGGESSHLQHTHAVSEEDGFIARECPVTLVQFLSGKLLLQDEPLALPEAKRRKRGHDTDRVTGLQDSGALFSSLQYYHFYCALPAA